MSNMLDISERGGDPTWVNLDNVLTVGIIRRKKEGKKVLGPLGESVHVVLTTAPAGPGIVLPPHISIEQVISVMEYTPHVIVE